jgi:dihydrofolate reductase
VVSFIKAGLIDEFRFMINPVVLGASRTIFDGLDKKLGFELVKSQKFNSGNVLLTYKPATYPVG